MIIIRKIKEELTENIGENIKEKFEEEAFLTTHLGH